MKSATLELVDLSCPSCTAKIEGALKRLDGVDSETIKVLFNSSKVKLNFDENVITIEEVEKALNNLGYDIKKTKVN